MSAKTNDRRRRPPWVDFTDEELLELRFRDLKLDIGGTELAPRVERLYEELRHRDLRFRPHVWLSTEWFAPDGVPGIAIPFYLAHPRLIKLEARQVLEVEGGTESSCMKVLRHEAGHAIDTAYRLHRRKKWREIFGSYAKPYPESYRARPNSRSYVLHLDAWYAQAHPAEDFAETFAVWLRPRSAWRRRYADWPVALRKLSYVDELMQSIAGQPPPVNVRKRVDPIARLSQRLGEHYQQKRERYGVEWPDVYDRDLRRLFSDPRYAARPTAAGFLRSLRVELRTTVADWTGTHAYTIDQVLQDMIERCRQLKLRLATSRHRAKTEAVLLLAVHTMNCLHAGRRDIPL